jgi:hypothetical protein
VPMLTCGLVRSNFAFATGESSWTDFSAVLTAGLWWSDVMERVWCESAAGPHGARGRGPRRVVRDPGRPSYSPVAFAMISLATFVGTSAYESKTIV